MYKYGQPSHDMLVMLLHQLSFALVFPALMPSSLKTRTKSTKTSSTSPLLVVVM